MKGEEAIRIQEWSNNKDNCAIDWELYHMLTDARPVTIAELVERSGWNRSVVEASISRLENNCLIAIVGDSVNLLSLSDILMLNEMMHFPDMQIYVENGVIRVKKQ
jgi:hypothetical protein